MTQAVQDFRAALLDAIDSRAAYESAKNVDNTSMQKTLSDIRKSVNHDTIANMMLASNVDAAIINRAERSNNRFNVYSYEKIVNVARYLASVASINHYTRAILASVHAFETAEFTFTHKDAVCACSKAVKQTDSKKESILKSVRYDKHVAANTASTQASSSLNALIAFNVLRESRDEANNVTYSLNRDTQATQDIAAKLELAI